MRPFDLAETDRLLTTTNAVRRRLDLTRPVDRSVITSPDRAPTAMRSDQYASIYPAVWSFPLALRSRGLGSVLTTPTRRTRRPWPRSSASRTRGTRRP